MAQQHTPNSMPVGAIRSFERVYDEHATMVYDTAHRVLRDDARAQDVVQDVFLRIWRDWDRYDSERGAVGAYLRVMARTTALDGWREARVISRARARLRLVAGDDEGRVDERPADALERRRDGDLVRGGLMQLPDVQREAVVLAYWGGLTAEQISEQLAVPLGTVKSRIRLGLLKLREHCGHDLDREVSAA